MRRTRIQLSPATKRTLATLALAAILPLTGCQKIAVIYRHILRHFHHDAGAAAAAAAAAGTTPAPSAAPTPVPTPAAPTPPPAMAINKSAGAIVLLYHRFEDHPHNDLEITPTEFEKEMQELKDNGFTVIPMQDFIAWRHGEKNIPDKSCIITIDDGYISGYDIAWPILKKFGYPFTMFIYIDYIGAGGKSISWDQLAEMRDAGVDIECHTYSHSHLDSPGYGVDPPARVRVEKDIQTLGRDGWLRKEIIDSKKVLQQNLGIKVDAFAYPYGTGDHNPQIRAIIKEAGYDMAFNVYGQRNGYSFPAYDEVGRYAIGGNNAAKIFAEAMTMVGGGGGPATEPAFAQLASASMVTEPAEGATIKETMPTIRANLATMGAIDPGSVRMRISGMGPVPAKYDPKTHIVSYTVPTPLAKDTYFVFLDATLNGKQAETKWNFNVDPAAKPSGPDMSLPARTP